MRDVQTYRRADVPMFRRSDLLPFIRSCVHPLFLMKKLLCLSILLICSLYASSQGKPRELGSYYSVEQYLNEMSIWVFDTLMAQGVFVIENGDTNLSELYTDEATGQENDTAYRIMFDAYAAVAMGYQRKNSPLYMQHLEFDSNVYALFFSMAIFDDYSWHVVKFSKEEWNSEEGGESIIFNYDEADPNADSVHIFIQEPYLVMSRGGLYYSLYNLESDSLLINSESPWFEGGDNTLEWVRENLDQPIREVLSRESSNTSH